MTHTWKEANQLLQQRCRGPASTPVTPRPPTPDRGLWSRGELPPLALLCTLPEGTEITHHMTSLGRPVL